MSAYPAQIDNGDTLGVGADRIGTATLETTLTAACLSTDTTISVADAIGPGFAAAAMHLRIGDEIVKYTGRTATSFTGLSRGLSGPAAAHAAGTPVRAVFTWLQILALQQAVIAIETALGITGAYNFAAASHAHAAADITSGTMAVARLPVMGAASAGSAGTAGIVPQPAAGDQAKVLSGAGTWVAQSGGAANAAALPSTAFSGIEATNVQAALEEIAAERATTSHSHAASAISYTPGGTISASNVQSALDELSDEKVPTSRTVSTGSGLDGGGSLAGNLTLVNTGVISFKTRNGAVTAQAGDYTDTQIDSNPSGWPGWMNGASTVRQALNEIINEIDSVKSDLASRYTNSQIDSGLAGKASNTHVHQEYDTGGTTGGPIG